MLLGRAFFEEEETGHQKSEQTASKIASKNPQEARHQAQALEEETTHERRSCVRLGTWWRGARADEVIRGRFHKLRFFSQQNTICAFFGYKTRQMPIAFTIRS